MEGGPVKVLVKTQPEAGERLIPVGAARQIAKAVQQGQHAFRGHVVHSALAVRSAELRGAVEVAIDAFGKGAVWIGTVCLIETGQAGEGLSKCGKGVGGEEKKEIRGHLACGELPTDGFARVGVSRLRRCKSAWTGCASRGHRDPP